MARKVNITLSDSAYGWLDQAAEQQGRTPTGLAAFLVEYCLVSGHGLTGASIKEQSSHRNQSDTIESDNTESAAILAQFIQAVASGHQPSQSVVLETAKLTGLDSEKLIELSSGRRVD
ncbi:MAG: hypothetical protein ACFBSC_18050 [Microcoleaceae cyanobacterium]